MEQPQVRRATWRIGARERARLQALVVGIVCLLLFFFVFRPFIGNVIERRDFQVCQTNMRQIAHAVRMYSGDWDDTLPAAAVWMDAARGFMNPTSGTGFSLERYFHCPRDRSGSASSYLYNDLLSGLSTSVRPGAAEEAQRLQAIRRPLDAPLVIEKHGSAENAHLPLPDWAAVGREMTRPHNLPTPTGSLVTGGGAVQSKNDEQLGALAGKRF